MMLIMPPTQRCSVDRLFSNLRTIEYQHHPSRDMPANVGAFAELSGDMQECRGIKQLLQRPGPARVRPGLSRIAQAGFQNQQGPGEMLHRNGVDLLSNEYVKQQLSGGTAGRCGFWLEV